MDSSRNPSKNSGNEWNWNSLLFYSRLGSAIRLDVWQKSTHRRNILHERTLGVYGYFITTFSIYLTSHSTLFRFSLWNMDEKYFKTFTHAHLTIGLYETGKYSYGYTKRKRNYSDRSESYSYVNLTCEGTLRRKYSQRSLPVGNLSSLTIRRTCLSSSERLNRKWRWRSAEKGR